MSIYISGEQSREKIDRDQSRERAYDREHIYMHSDGHRDSDSRESRAEQDRRERVKKPIREPNTRDKKEVRTAGVKRESQNKSKT